jgi:hypothetical protein
MPPDLGGKIDQRFMPGHLGTQQQPKGDDGIEVRAGYRPERRNQRDQRGTRGNGIGEQCNRDVAACQTLRHDARADDGSEQKRRAHQFSYSTPDHSRPSLVAYWRGRRR